MTLKDFFDVLSANPSLILFYFIAVPLTALLACMFSKNEGHLSPWKELFSTLLYLTAVPGIFAIMLTLYLFMFEQQSIMATNIYTQILPVVSMIMTIYIIKGHVDLDELPGFDKLSGLIWMILSILLLLWLLDRTHIFAIIFLPLPMVVLILVALLVVVRIGWRRMTA